MKIGAAALLAGVLLLQQLPVLCPSPWLYAVGLLTLSAAVWRRNWTLVFLLAGFLLAHYDAQLRLADRLAIELQGIDIEAKGVVASIPEADAQSVRFNFDVESSARSLPAHIRLSWYYPERAIKAGQSWRFIVRLKRPHGNLNPGGFDYERWLLLQGIGATGYVHNPSAAEYLGESGLAYMVLHWRQYLADRLADLVPASANLGLLRALTIGDGQAITQRQWDIFRQTGTVHLIVISGSHIALLAGWVYVLARKAWIYTGCLRYAPHTVAAGCALITAIVYTLLAGFALPAQRAMVMTLAGLCALILQRQVRTGHVLALAALLLVALQPVAVLAPGFWLSFGAVMWIAYVLAGRLRQPSWWFSALKIQVAISLGLTPLLVWFFQQVSLLSPLANVIAVPLISFWVVPLALLAVLILPLSPLVSGWLLQLADWCLRGLDWTLQALLRLPGMQLSLPQPSLWTVLLALLGMAVLLAPRGIAGRWLVSVLCVPLLLPLRENVADGAARVTLLDVGQGLSAVVQTRSHVLVFDTGAKYSDTFDMGQMAVLPFLRAQGQNHIDEVIISHGDLDHRGGLESILRGITVVQVSGNTALNLPDRPALPCRSGQQWQWDNVRFNMLAPSEAGFASDNDNSCVLKVESLYGSALLPGDIEAAAETWLVENYRERLRADVLIAPHHGSNTSSTLAFLAQVKPLYILIASGYRNRFGFPHPEVLKRYREIGAHWLDSSDSGAITVNLDQQGKSVAAYRRSNRHYWNE